MSKKTNTGTGEWADKTENLICGCAHDCKYCYAKAIAIRMKRRTPINWKNEEVNLKRVNKRFKKFDGWYMFPSSHDITDINPENLDLIINHLKSLLSPGNKVLIVTKAHITVMKRLCFELQEYKDQILFRITIGSTDSQILNFWEPGAPSFEERLESLKYAFEYGFKTSVSAEPMLDGEPVKLVNDLEQYVTNTIWFGKPNRLILQLKLNGHSDSITLSKARELKKLHNDDWILSLYAILKDNPKIEWKESIKKVINKKAIYS